MSLAASSPALTDRVAVLDWQEIAKELNNVGCATASSVLTPGECRSVAGMYGEEKRFRSRIVMAQHGFGRGEYQYFGYPLPEIVADLRASLYWELVHVANRWNQVLGIEESYPAAHPEFLMRCH